MDDMFLVHHGIKGMKWGVWNDETRAKRLGGGKKNRASNSKKAVANRKKERKNAEDNVSLMSDKELDMRIRRLEKEKRFKELSRESLSPGKKIANDLLSDNGKKVLGIAVGLVATAVIQEQLAKRGFGKESIKAKDKNIAKKFEKKLEKELSQSVISPTSKSNRSEKIKNAIASADKKLEVADEVLLKAVDSIKGKKGSRSWLSGTMR